MSSWHSMHFNRGRCSSRPLLTLGLSANVEPLPLLRYVVKCTSSDITPM